MLIRRILDDVHDQRTAPGWLAMARADGTSGRPLLRCRCGALLSLRRHFIAPDGRVTGSFLHPSCGFHETLELEGYAGPEFVPEPEK